MVFSVYQTCARHKCRTDGLGRSTNVIADTDEAGSQAFGHER
jgi:hypothetical protein